MNDLPFFLFHKESNSICTNLLENVVKLIRLNKKVVKTYPGGASIVAYQIVLYN